MASATVTRRVQYGSEVFNETKTYTGTGGIEIEESIADSTTDGEVAFTLDVSEIVAFWAHSDQAVTIETNDGSSPGDTITLAAGVPLIWTENDDHANPLTTDVTALFITNASGAAATVSVGAVYDATP